MVLERHLDLLGKEDHEVLCLAWLNSRHRTGMRNLMDAAVLRHAEEQRDSKGMRLPLHCEEVDELPFDFLRRHLSVVVRDAQGDHLLVCKGAVDLHRPGQLDLRHRHLRRDVDRFRGECARHQSLFQSGWFIEGLLSQTLVVHLIRTRRIPFFQSAAPPPVLLLTGAIMACGICLPFSPLGEAVGLQALPWGYFPWLAGILLGYGALTQAIKLLYIRRFGGWL